MAANMTLKGIKKYLLKDVQQSFENQNVFNTNVKNVIDELLTRVENLEATSHKHIDNMRQS